MNNGGTLYVARTSGSYPTGECFDIINWDGRTGLTAIPVVAGARYELSVYAASTSGVRGVKPFVAWYDGASTYLSSSYGTETYVGALGGQSLSQYTRVYDFFVAPANAAIAVVGFATYFNAAGNWPFAFFTRPQFAEAGATQSTTPSILGRRLGRRGFSGDEITTEQSRRQDRKPTPSRPTNHPPQPISQP